MAGPGTSQPSTLLEKGDPQNNTIIIIGEQIAKMSSTAGTPWYKKHISTGKAKDGLWIGNGFNNQFHMEPSKITPEMKEEMPRGFGYVLRKGKTVKVKLLCSPNSPQPPYP